MKIQFKTFQELKSKTAVLFRELDRYSEDLKKLLRTNGVPFEELGDYKIIVPDQDPVFRRMMKDEGFRQVYEQLNQFKENIKRSCGIDDSKAVRS